MFLKNENAMFSLPFTSELNAWCCWVNSFTIFSSDQTSGDRSKVYYGTSPLHPKQTLPLPHQRRRAGGGEGHTGCPPPVLSRPAAGRVPTLDPDVLLAPGQAPLR